MQRMNFNPIYRSLQEEYLNIQISAITVKFTGPPQGLDIFQHTQISISF
jgi:hypothetical protein